MSLLQRGQRFTMGGRRFRVLYVNASRAHCESLVRVPVTLRDAHSGAARTFTATRRVTIDIAPTSAVDLFPELERRS